MRSSLIEKIYNSRKSLLMFSSPWCQAGLSVQLAEVISCPLPAGWLLFWSHCCRNAGQASGCPTQDSQVCSTHPARSRHSCPGPSGMRAQQKLFSLLKLFRCHFQISETMCASATFTYHSHCSSKAQAHVHRVHVVSPQPCVGPKLC